MILILVDCSISKAPECVAVRNGSQHEQQVNTAIFTSGSK